MSEVVRGLCEMVTNAQLKKKAADEITALAAIGLLYFQREPACSWFQNLRGSWLVASFLCFAC